MIVKLWRAVYVVGSDGVVLQGGLVEGDFSGVCAYRQMGGWRMEDGGWMRRGNWGSLDFFVFARNGIFIFGGFELGFENANDWGGMACDEVWNLDSNGATREALALRGGWRGN
jgi:hypothetical protein